MSYRPYSEFYRVKRKSNNGRVPNKYNPGQANLSRYYLSGLPGLGDFIRAYDSKKYWNDYLRNRGKTWADVKYPSMLQGSSNLGSGMMKALYGASSLNVSEPEVYQALYDFEAKDYMYG